MEKLAIAPLPHFSFARKTFSPKYYTHTHMHTHNRPPSNTYTLPTSIPPANPNYEPQLPSTTYNIPNTDIRIKLRAQSFAARPMHPAALSNLISTGLVALDLLAAEAGGFTSPLNVPRLRWAISGLVIFMNDATARDPQSHGGPFRWDEMR
ncbi:MAG: hypothetical protein Q9200_007814, partial [Gallowayella weberi]